MCAEPALVEYFVVAGLPPSGAGPEEEPRPKEPITDVALIARAQGEEAPLGYTCIEATPTGTPAELSAGLRERLCLCYRRGRDRAPLVELGVHYEGAEPRAGHVLVRTTPYSRGAALRGGGAGAPRAFLSFRRARAPAGPALLGVSDLCLVAPARGESAPHAYCREGRSLSAGPWGPALYLCYKLSMASANTLVYEAALLSRYPAEDTASFPLPASVPVFCLPMGATVESWPSGAQFPLPLFTPFVLTGASGDKVYGASLQFHESVSPERLSERQLLRLGLLSLVERVPVPGRSAHGRRSIALLSRWPFFRVFRSFLTFLYRYSISGPHVLPIEAHISHFMHNVPFPSPQRPRILVQLSPYDSVLLCRPVSSPLPLSGASFLSLVRCVGPDTALVLLVAVLTEHKVLIHSLRPHRLTSVGEALVAMIFPLRWQCPYIPLCPLPLWDVLSAPVPFIVGLHSSYFDLHEPPRDVVCVDLDTNTVTPSQERKLLPPRALPRRPCKVLQSSLQSVSRELQEMYPAQEEDAAQDVDLDLALVLGDAGTGGTGGTGVTGVTGDAGGRRAQLELQVQAAFLRFMACVLRGYRSFLRPVQLQSPPGGSDTHNLFDMQGFLRSRERGYHRFYSQLLRTQLFAQFLEECSFGADREPCLDFFDACVDKVQPDLERPEDTPLIEVDDARGGERTVLITPPEQPVAPDGSELPAQYHYDGFPTLRPELLEPPREPLVAQLCQARSSAPSSPAPCRTQQEMKAAQRVAQRSCSVPELWGRFLLGHCYGLWFLYLPSHVRAAPARLPALHQAYGVLRRMERHKVVLPDEVCYRVLLQLCGQYGEPVLAVRVMLEMKRAGIVPNAVTYGYYNKAVLESKWPSGAQSARRHWAMLRNVVLGVARFRQPLRQRHRANGTAPPRPPLHRQSTWSGPPPPAPPPAPRGLGAKLQQLLSPARRGTGLTPPRGRGGGTPPQRSSGGTLRAAERPESESSSSLGSDLDLSDPSLGISGIPKPSDPDVALDEDPPAVEVLLSSCSRCPGCGALVYDEEVMAGWSSDDSNLNTTCPFCTRCFLPFLSIEIRHFQQGHGPPEPGPSPPPGPVLSDRSRCLALDESDTEQSNGSDQAVVRRECASFAYLSPLVLRKELERALEAEGGAALARAALWGARPILFWNLLWCFRRLALPSGLPRLLLPHGTQLPPSGSVRVRLLWDVLTPEPDTCPPLYVLWHLHSKVPTRFPSPLPHGHPFTLAFLEAVLSHVGLSELHKAITLLLDTPGGALPPQRSIYREILFLTLAALGREHVDIAAFDRKYRSAFTRLAGNRSLEQLRLRRAQPPSPKAIDCRKSFGPPPEC
ncbi:DENN domain-containing protein 4B [Melopsittacus undulatus]|uniref:DENN domain-containing protein 4B n=1 Tax=Melopsittacus undulatus TaxID=13146 RepID=UPI00146BA68C|nr:DENN domain-containing protein 4B [Melopsittacus undulatus]